MHPRTLHGLAQAAYANHDVTAAIAYYLRAWDVVDDDYPLAVRIANELAYVCLYDLNDVQAAERWAMRMQGCVVNDIDLARLFLLRKRLAAGATGEPRAAFSGSTL